MRTEAERAVDRAAATPPKPGYRPPAPRKRQRATATATEKRTPVSDDRKLDFAVGGRTSADAIRARLRDATRAFERERYVEARKMLEPIAGRAPGAAAVRELLGLTYYRLGRWREAIRELEAFRGFDGSTEQHPVLADSYRALGRYDEVDEIWDELRARSPSAALVAEGRIVAAGARADQGDLKGAMRLLEAGTRPVRKPREHHLRLWYALADIYERAGEIPRARQLFERVAAADDAFADVSVRLRSLG